MFWPIFNSINYAHIKGCKQDNFESHNSLKLNLTFEAFIQILLNVDHSLNSQLSWHSCLWDKLEWLNSQLILAISLWGVSLFILKGFYYSYAWFCSLSEGRISFFCIRLFTRKLSVNSYLRFQLALLHSVSYFFSLYQSPSLPSCKVFDANFI